MIINHLHIPLIKEDNKRNRFQLFQTNQNRNSPIPEIKSTETSQNRSIPEGKEERWLKKSIVSSSSSSSAGPGAGAGAGADVSATKGSEVRERN